MTMLLSNAMVAGNQRLAPIRATLERLSLDSDGDPRLAGSVKVIIALDPAAGDALPRRLEILAADPDRYTALPAWHWLSHVRENTGRSGRGSPGRRACARADGRERRSLARSDAPQPARAAEDASGRP